MVQFYYKTPALNCTDWRKSGKATMRISGRLGGGGNLNPVLSEYETEESLATP